MEKLHERKKLKRYETREEIPATLSLRASIVYPQSAVTETEAAWAGNMKEVYSLDADVTCPLVYPRSWITDAPRSLYIRKGGRWVQYKGAGNPLNCEPPLLTDHNDFGHSVLNVVDHIEARRIIRRATFMQDAVCLRNSFSLMHLQEVVKLEEIPIPLSRGGVEIRDVISAYTIPWEFNDDMRVHQIELMRKELVAISLQSDQAVSVLTDKEVIERYHRECGFYQVRVEQDAPFRNDIIRLVENPLILEAHLGFEETSLERQARLIQQITVRFFEDVIGVEFPTSFAFPKFSDLEREIGILDEGEVTGQDRLALDRLYWTAQRNKILVRDAESLALKLYNSEARATSLRQLDGLAYLQRVVAALPEEVITQAGEWVAVEMRQTIINMANSLILGLDLRDSLGPKDSLGAKITDLGYTGRFILLSAEGSQEEMAQELIRKTEDAWTRCMNSVFAFSLLAGMDGVRTYDVFTNFAPLFLMAALQDQGDFERPPDPEFDNAYNQYRDTITWIRKEVAKKAEKSQTDLNMADYQANGVPMALAVTIMVLEK
ncbi:MAG: hypothetical protein ABIE03_05875 [Patescibacteria group bacterium]|nr:hypothetical protein [Patescibacteria group bacterium]